MPKSAVTEMQFNLLEEALKSGRVRINMENWGKVPAAEINTLIATKALKAVVPGGYEFEITDYGRYLLKLAGFEVTEKFLGPSSYIVTTQPDGEVQAFITGYTATESRVCEDIDFVVDFDRHEAESVRLSLSEDHAGKLYKTLGEYLARRTGQPTHDELLAAIKKVKKVAVELTQSYHETKRKTNADHHMLGTVSTFTDDIRDVLDKVEL